MTNMFIETASGKYEIKRPGGKLGTESMVLLAKLSTVEGIQKVPDPTVEDPALIERIKASNNRISMTKMLEVFREWAPLILPGIVVKGPFTYDEMPDMDQFAIFVAINEQSLEGDTLFRVLPATPS